MSGTENKAKSKVDDVGQVKLKDRKKSGTNAKPSVNANL